MTAMGAIAIGVGDARGDGARDARGGERRGESRRRAVGGVVARATRAEAEIARSAGALYDDAVVGDDDAYEATLDEKAATLRAYAEAIERRRGGRRGRGGGGERGGGVDSTGAGQANRDQGKVTTGASEGVARRRGGEFVRAGAGG